MRSIMLTAATLAAALATPALAQDEMSPEKTGFNGPYIGGSFGAGLISNRPSNSIVFDRNGDGRFGDAVVTAAGANAFSPGFCNGVASSSRPTTGCSSKRDDYEYMGRLGVDAQTGGMVVGIVGEFGKVDFVDSVTAYSTTPASYTLSRSIKYAANIRGRVGYTPNSETLFYGTGGVAYARVRNGFTSSNTQNAFAVTGNRDIYGFAAGGGVEQKLTNNFSIGLEYLYTQLKDDKARVVVTQGTAAINNPFVLGGGTTSFARSDRYLRYNSIRLTAALRF